MADPTTPIDTKNIVDATEKAANASKVIVQLTEDMVNFGRTVGTSIQGLSDAFKNMNGQWSQFSAFSEKATKAMAPLAAGMGIVTSAVFGASKAFDAFKVSSSASINSVSSQYATFADNLKKATDLKINLPPVLQSLVNKAKELTGNYIESAASAQNFKNQLLGLYASTGQFNQLLGEHGERLANVDQKMAKLATEFGNLASISGYSTEQVSGFAAELGKIPGALEGFVKTKDAAGHIGKTMTELNAVMKVSSGTGQSVATVVENMTVAYEKLNLTGADALKYHAMISEASNSLGLRFKDTRDYTQSLAETFKFFGDNTEGALKVLNRFIPALNASKLSMQASKDLVKEMVTGIEHLTIGTKAFLSARSGGPGGLMGAFQIDKLVREGKLDEVMMMLEKNLKKQLGGRIVTADQAAESPQAAAAYMKQLALVKSDAFGGLVKSDAQAQKLFEAMSKGVGGADALKEGNEALNSTIEKGTNIQQEQKTILSEINAQLTTLINVSAIAAKINTDQLVGMKNASVKGYLGATTAIAEKSSGAFAEAADPTKGGVKTSSLPLMKVHEAQVKALGGLTSSIMGFTKVIGDVGVELKQKISEMVSSGEKAKTKKFDEEVFKNISQGEAPKSSFNVNTTELSSPVDQSAVGGGAAKGQEIKVAFEMTCIDCGKKEMKKAALDTIKGTSTAHGGIAQINEVF